MDLPDSAKLALAQLTSNMTVMTNTVFDLKSTSNDLLKVSTSNYKASIYSRREAWVNSTRLPQGIKNELKASRHVPPTALDTHEQPLAMLAPNEVKILEDYQRLLRDQALLGRSLAPATFVQRPDRGRPTSRRGGMGHHQSLNSPQNFQGYGQNFRGNSYRGRNPRGYRGNNRGRAGHNQPHTQPFSEASSKKKFD